MDLGIEKISKFTNKQKLLLMLVILLFVGVALFFLLIRPKYSDLKELEGKLSTLQTQVQKDRGMALVTALMMTMICLSIVMALFYLLGRGIEMSASHKRYRTALEASYGGAELVLKDVVPLIFQNMSSNTLSAQFAGADMQLPSGISCLRDKINKPTSEWSASCSDTLYPKLSSDLTFKLQATGNSAPFTVYSKIAHTIQGNSDVSGLQLEGAGVAESSPVITPQHFPYIYRVEIQAERSVNATERANLSVLYAY